MSSYYIEDLKKIEEDNRWYHPLLPSISEEEIFMGIDLEDMRNKRHNFMFKRPTRRISLKTLWIVFVVSALFSCGIAFLLRLERLPRDLRISIVASISMMFLICNLIFLFYMRVESHSFVRYHRFTMLSWIPIVIVFSFNAYVSNDLWFGNLLVLIPFFFERILISIESAIFIDKMECIPMKTLSTEEIINKGWKELIKYVHENVNPMDSNENLFLFHGISFIREFVLDIHHMKRNESDDVNIEIPTEYGQLCRMVLLSWMKYIHKKGEYVWDEEEDQDCVMNIITPEMKEMKRSLEQMLIVMTRNTDRSQGSIQNDSAGEILLDIYHTIIEKTEREIMIGFRKSPSYIDVMNKTIEQRSNHLNGSKQEQSFEPIMKQ